jgi:hypothetical protein
MSGRLDSGFLVFERILQSSATRGIAAAPKHCDPTRHSFGPIRHSSVDLSLQKKTGDGLIIGSSSGENAHRFGGGSLLILGVGEAFLQAFASPESQ